MVNLLELRYDEITSLVIKTAREPMMQMLEKISKQVWKEEKSPKDWSWMLVSPIHKKGDKLDPANYCMIMSLMESVQKEDQHPWTTLVNS